MGSVKPIQTPNPDNKTPPPGLGGGFKSNLEKTLRNDY